MTADPTPTAVEALRVAAHEINRWMLVIESAVRHDAPRDHLAVTLALKANRDALAGLKLHGGGENGGSLPPVALLELRRGVYVASRASIPDRGQMWRDLRAAGVEITSTWIDEDGPGETADFADLWPRIQREVTSSERLIAYLEPDDFPVRGVLIEIGMALAANVPVFIVAPGVRLEGRSKRPLGSWVKHPLVSFRWSVQAALEAAVPDQQASTDASEPKTLSNPTLQGPTREEVASPPADKAGRAVAALDVLLKRLDDKAFTRSTWDDNALQESRDEQLRWAVSIRLILSHVSRLEAENGKLRTSKQELFELAYGYEGDLKLAVEALEKIEARDWRWKGGGSDVKLLNLNGQIAHNALRSISSLRAPEPPAPPSDVEASRQSGGEG